MIVGCVNESAVFWGLSDGPPNPPRCGPKMLGLRHFKAHRPYHHPWSKLKAGRGPLDRSLQHL